MIKTVLNHSRIARRIGVYAALLIAMLTLAFRWPVVAQEVRKNETQVQTIPVNEHWTGDFDMMAEKRQIRALVVYSKTFYFLDRGRQRGISYDLLKEFEKMVNKKLKTKTLKINVVFIPVQRDELITGLTNGLGDVAVANLTITPQRLKHVDFSNPLLSGVKELLVTGPAAAPLARVDDLAGEEIRVRKSSSYYESLVRLNQSLKKAGKSQIQLVPAEETFEDEDLLEMVNAGLIPMIVMDSHKAQFWTQIFDKIQVHSDIAVRTGGEIGWAFRKDSPQLKAVVNEFLKGHKKGSLIGNMVLKRYLKSTKYVKNSLASYNAEPAKVRQLRKKTADMGLNPNIWFHNVEVAAAKVIGRETVQYVSNIYKCYIAYRMVSEKIEKNKSLWKGNRNEQ